MIANQLIKQIKARRGPVCVKFQNLNDVFWVQAIKSDLIGLLSYKFKADEETGLSLDKNGYLSEY